MYAYTGSKVELEFQRGAPADYEHPVYAVSVIRGVHQSKARFI